MARKHPIRYLIAFALAATGGVVSQASAEALGADGVVAFALFLACLAVFCLPATALTVTLDPGAGRSGRRATRAKR